MVAAVFLSSAAGQATVPSQWFVQGICKNCFTVRNLVAKFHGDAEHLIHLICCNFDLLWAVHPSNDARFAALPGRRHCCGRISLDQSCFASKVFHAA